MPGFKLQETAGF